VKRDHEKALDLEASSGRLLSLFSARLLSRFGREGIRSTLMSRFNIGLVLLIVGAALLLIGGISYTTRERTPMGPIAIEHPEQHSLPYSPLAGAILSVSGGALMLTARAKNHQA
jgi:hypothetical protein